MEKYPNINVLLNLDSNYLPKAEFVIRTFCYILRLSPKFFYGIHYEGIHIYYGKENNHSYPIKIYCHPDSADFFEKNELFELNQVNFCIYKNEYIPFLFSKSGAIFSFSDQNCIIRKDIVASAFYFLTCWHEYVLSNKGVPKGRVDYRESLQYRWDFTEIPVVDVYCQLLLYIVEVVLPEFQRDIHWNEDRKFVVSLSHDVDYWNYWDNEQLYDNIKYNLSTFHKRPLSSFYKLISHNIHKRLFNNPWRNIHRIVRGEADRNIDSTWFLLARNDFPDQRQNYLFDVKYREHVLDLLGQFDIGLHGSPESAFDLNQLEAELNNLRHIGLNPVGFRTHYLHFDYQTSFSILEKANIKYDSTLGYWEHVGFRAGISFPFYPFNIKENRPFRVLEIPLIVMDTSLYSPKAMNLSVLSSKQTINRLIDLAAKYQSHISILWHNTTFDPVDYPFWSMLYWNTINYSLKKKGWITSLKNVYEQWVDLSY